jgi:hypothetical protein
LTRIAGPAAGFFQGVIFIDEIDALFCGEGYLDKKPVQCSSKRANMKNVLFLK